MVDGRVAHVRLEAQGELQEPVPLRVQGGHVRLHRFRGRVVLQDERLASVLHGAHLDLPALELAHQCLHDTKPTLENLVWNNERKNEKKH